MLPMFKRGSRTVVQALREAITSEVHFAEIGPVVGRPGVLRIEGPGALSGAAERAVIGRERELRRAGFRMVECIGVDPVDERGRHGRLRASVPEEHQAWSWDRLAGEELQTRIIEAAEVEPEPQPAERERVAGVIELKPRRRRGR